MNVLDYLKTMDTTCSVLSEAYGHIWFAGDPGGDDAQSDACDIAEILGVPRCDDLFGSAQVCLSEETADFLTGVELRLESGTENYEANARRPYYRMRGSPVTPEQAREIIRRTDGLVRELTWWGGPELAAERACIEREYLGCINFNQWWLSRNHFPTHYGWSHPDGTVGCNGITQKYPRFREFLVELLRWKRVFPWLDLMIAVTDWDEHPSGFLEAFNTFLKADTSKTLAQFDEAEEKALAGYRADDMDTDTFCASVEIGICTHDNVIEFLAPKQAAARYREYEKRYALPDGKFFTPEYYERSGGLICGEDYLLRCVMDYGIDAQRAQALLAGVPDYEWRDSEFPRR